MNLEKFIHDLHYDTDKARPPELEVDWEDAPLPYKLYRRLPVVPLSAEVPLTLEGREAPSKPNLGDIGHFLWYTFGLAQVCQSVFHPDSREQTTGSVQLYRRFAPSGGGLYPNELYIYLKMENLPVGVYHYDSAHHRLALLREGDQDAWLAQALGLRCDVSACFGIVFVSTVFWKNFFKYHDFSYRLQGLDAGVAIGQLLETAKRFGFETAVFFQFLDRPVGRLLGLSEQEESVYAVIPLSAQPAAAWFTGGIDGDGTASAGELSLELPEIRHDCCIRSRKVKEYPMLIRMNESSTLEYVRSFRRIGEESKSSGDGNREDRPVKLPRVERLSYDLARVCRARFSPDTEYVMNAVSLSQLAALLLETAASFPYRNDLDGAMEKPELRVALYVCLHGVEGIPDGAYRYDSDAHALRPVRPGDHRFRLQQAMTLNNVNLFQVPFCFHVAGDRDHLKARLGYRGYRIQQMEAGMLVQRLLLAASALEMAGRPLLGFDAELCDAIYDMAQQGKTSLIQIPVGRCRHRCRLQGSLHG